MAITCSLCGKKIEKEVSTRASKSRTSNAILVSALQLLSPTAPEVVKRWFALMSTSRVYYCVSHDMDAVQHLLAEMLASGGALSETLDHVAYVNQSSISEYLVFIVNDAIHSFSSDITIRNYDLMRYLNEHLKRNYRNGNWSTSQSTDSEQGIERPETTMEATTSGTQNFAVNMDYQILQTPLIEKSSGSPAKSVASTLGIPSVKHADSGSSGKTATGSYFSPGKVPTSDSEAALELEETDPDLLDKYFIVQGRKLLELFNLASSEGEAGNVCLKTHPSGAIPLIEYATKGPKPEIKKWEGQGKLGEGPKEKLFSGTSLACAAAITTGARWTKVSHWANEMNLLLPSRTAFYEFFKRMRPAIETVYNRHEARTILEIKSAYENQRPQGWNVAIDGAYDSRGHSAEFCKVLAVDLRTGYCIHTEVVHRSETDGKSGLMEKVGCHRILRWFRSMDIPIHSICTDRSYALKKEIDSYNAEYGDDVRWYVDPWHLAKYLDKGLRAIEKRKDCEAIHDWKEHLKAHLYHSIRRGAEMNSGDMMRDYFNTCLYHVAGIHRWNQNKHTGSITQCMHEGVSDDGGKAMIAWGSPAHEKLKEVILQEAFQKDIKLASPYGGTSQCESKNSLDRIYGPKEIHLPASTYSVFANLSTLHKNALRRAELCGERVVERVTVAHRKFSERESRIERKTPIEHLWRKEMWIEFVSHYTAGPADRDPMDYEDMECEDMEDEED